ncbi:MAG: DUF4147 domain-containing protein [Balneolales bacterium]
MNLNQKYKEQEKKLRQIFNQALSASQPDNLVRNFIHLADDYLVVGKEKIQLKGHQKIWVLGSGKAASVMAVALENKLASRIHGGVVICSKIPDTTKGKIRHLMASHPIPDEDSVSATQELVSLAKSIPPDDLVIYVMSGGSSALLCMPPEEITLDIIRETHDALLNCGANIHETNTVRKHMSIIKGGQLGQILKDVNVISLNISDVPGDELEDIGSGPLVRDSTTFVDAWQVLAKYSLLSVIPKMAVQYIEKGIKGIIPETLKSDIEKHRHFVLGNATYTAQQASLEAEKLGYSTWLSDEAYSDDTHVIADNICRSALSVLDRDEPVKKPAALIYYGESYLNVKGKGKGGRNQEMALTASISLEGRHYVSMLSAGTDGRDGPTDAAGAICTGYTATLAGKAGIKPETYLKNNDSYHFFEALGSLIITGDTGNNVMDLQIVLIE